MTKSMTAPPSAVALEAGGADVGAVVGDDGGELLEEAGAVVAEDGELDGVGLGLGGAGG